MALYAEITGVSAPSEALPGDLVDITVTIKNLFSSAIAIMVAGALEYGVSPWPGIDFPDNWDNVDAGASRSFGGSFTMPDKKVTIHAYSYYYASDGYWYFDDEKTRAVNVAVLTPQISELKIADFKKV